eukprot:497777-Prymnesium_polylepis.2
MDEKTGPSHQMLRPPVPRSVASGPRRAKGSLLVGVDPIAQEDGAKAQWRKPVEPRELVEVNGELWPAVDIFDVRVPLRVLVEVGCGEDGQVVERLHLGDVVRRAIVEQLCAVLAHFFGGPDGEGLCSGWRARPPVEQLCDQRARALLTRCCRVRNRTEQRASDGWRLLHPMNVHVLDKDVLAALLSEALEKACLQRRALRGLTELIVGDAILLFAQPRRKHGETKSSKRLDLTSTHGHRPCACQWGGRHATGIEQIMRHDTTAKQRSGQ